MWEFSFQTTNNQRHTSNRVNSEWQCTRQQRRTTARRPKLPATTTTTRQHAARRRPNDAMPIEKNCIRAARHRRAAPLSLLALLLMAAAAPALCHNAGLSLSTVISVCLSIHLPICLSVYPPMHQCICCRAVRGDLLQPRHRHAATSEHETLGAASIPDHDRRQRDDDAERRAQLQRAVVVRGQRCC